MYLPDVPATGRGPPEHTEKRAVGALQPIINADSERRRGACVRTCVCMWERGRVHVKLIAPLNLLSQCWEDVRKTLEVSDIVTDINCFVEMKATGSTPPGNEPTAAAIWICAALLCSLTPLAFQQGFEFQYPDFALAAPIEYEDYYQRDVTVERNSGGFVGGVMKRSDWQQKVFTFCTNINVGEYIYTALVFSGKSQKLQVLKCIAVKLTTL